MGLVYSFNPLGGPVKIGGPSPIPTIDEVWDESAWGSWQTFSPPTVAWLRDVKYATYGMGMMNNSAVDQFQFVALFDDTYGLLWTGFNHEHSASGVIIKTSDDSWHRTFGNLTGANEFTNNYINIYGAYRSLSNPQETSSLDLYINFYGPNDEHLAVNFPFVDQNGTKQCLCLVHENPTLSSWTSGNYIARAINISSGENMWCSGTVNGQYLTDKIVNIAEPFEVGLIVQG